MLCCCCFFYESLYVHKYHSIYDLHKAVRLRERSKEHIAMTAGCIQWMMCRIPCGLVMNKLEKLNYLKCRSDMNVKDEPVTAALMQ